jgi:uncharacterized protein (UPF0276 family)
MLRNLPTKSVSFDSGIGLKSQHAQMLLDEKAQIGFLEAHSENYFGGGRPRQHLRDLAKQYKISLHGVGLSLGRADGLDKTHLQRLKSLIDEIDPLFVSEHLSWSGYSHTHVPDLLPIPFTTEALAIFVDHVNQFQDFIGRPILVENPSNYLAFKDLDFTEMEFLNQLSLKTGCGLLLDLNNIIVSAHNLGYNAIDYVNEINANQSVQQFHLAGYQINNDELGDPVYLDTHGHAVYPETWDLYAHALRRFGDLPTLIEWDTDVPDLEILIAEAKKADHIRQSVREDAHVRVA